MKYLCNVFERRQICKDGAIAQLVEQRTENPCVPGSIPGGTTSLNESLGFFVSEPPLHAYICNTIFSLYREINKTICDMRKLLVCTVVAAVFLASCSTVPVTGRRQLSLVSSGEMVTLGEQNYKQTLQQSKLSTNKAQVDRIKRVGSRIQKAVEQYMSQNGMASQLEGFNWEFNLIENDTTVNAWCMPGGKVAFYTGILPICKDDNGIAVVMGHEIAHAIANHSGERMSQAMALELGGQVGSILLSGKTQQTQQAFQLLYPIGSQVAVILPYSRSHELEADKMGLIFMAMAGYNPETAIPFWERMAASSGGGRPPQFLSTHPAEQARIDKIRAVLPEVMKYYKPANNK